MPTYEYICKKCGPFTQLRPMAECELPSACPECGRRAPRVLLTAPGCLTMSAEARPSESVSASLTDLASRDPANFPQADPIFSVRSTAPVAARMHLPVRRA